VVSSAASTRTIRIISAAVLALGVAAGVLRAYIGPLPSPELPAVGDTRPSSMILDRDGRLLYEMADPHGGRQRRVGLDEVPLHLWQAVVATEDARFYAHHGVDAIAIVRAAFSNLRAGHIVSGASTIPQQLARLLLLPSAERTELTLRRKLREALLAISLSLRYSRDELLEHYLNQNYFGALAYGVDSASRAYFGKPVAHLDLAESAMLAGLIQSPASYSPLTHEEAARKRQQVVLGLMVQSGYITAQEASEAAQEQLRYAGGADPMLAPHAVVYAREELDRLLPPEVIAAGGLRVITTITWPLQQRAERALSRHLERLNTPQPAEPAHDVHNGAVVVLDVPTGGIAVMVGSPDYDNAVISGAVNGALAMRQPGSAVKPFTYAAAFERGYSPATVINDIATTFITADGKAYQPINYDYRFHGPVTLRQALACSYNVVAVSLLDRIGVEALPELAHRAGVSALRDTGGHGLAMTLGSSEVDLLQLARGYATLARSGFYVGTHIIERVESVDGGVLYQYQPQAPVRAVDARAAYLVTDILADNDARLPAFGARSPLETGLPAAVKTGTTTDWRDNWTLGYTTASVVGVWVGNADGAPMRGVSGVTGAAPIWNEIMHAAHRQRPATFERPDGLEAVRICSLSGELPGIACTHTREEWFIAGTAPTETCNMHQLAYVDVRTGQIATDLCGAPQCVRKSIVAWPVEVLPWAIDQGLATTRAFAAVSDTSASTPDTRAPLLAIVQPVSGTRYTVSASLPPESQAVEVRVGANGLPADASVTLLLDGQAVAGWQREPRSWLWQLEPGEHTFSAVAYLTAGQAIVSDSVTVYVSGVSGGR
jgi:penicillin-binding protein 1C